MDCNSETSETIIAGVMLYAGRTFKTFSGSKYTITSDGRISGREHIEGASVKYVVGIETALRAQFIKCLSSWVPKEKLDELIAEYGKVPREGLCLVVSLRSKSAEEKDRKGMVTSAIEKITPSINYN